MRRHPVLWLIATLLLIDASGSTAGEVSDQDRFHLWNGCQPIGLAVAFEKPKWSKNDLTKEGIEATVRSRLRAARIYGDSDSAVTILIVEVVQVIKTPPLFRIKFEHYKMLMDEMSEVRDFSRTWFEYRWSRAADIGTVLSVLAQSTDRFIDEYLRVNGDACQ